jgi:type IV secretory pathway VirJ component
VPLALLLGVLLWLFRSPATAQLETKLLQDGSPLRVAQPEVEPKVRILLAASETQQLSDAQLLKLADENAAQVVQVLYPATAQCAAWPARLVAARKALGKAEPDLVAGIETGAAYAWRWLAVQQRDQAQAISVGFSLDTPDCSSEPLPSQAGHGQWLVAWNNSPSTASGLFVRSQPRAETIISPYDTPLSQVLFSQIKRSLQGQGDPIPVIEVPSAQPSDTVTLFYSGDGGWRDLDRDIAERMAAKGFPVVGIDVLRYFWQHKSLEQGTADLEQLMQHYRDTWGAKYFVLAGYSFGADLLPAFYNRLPSAEQQQVKAMLLLALARTGGLEIKVQGWLGEVDTEFATGPEIAKLPAHKLYCVYGLDEKDDSGCTQDLAIGETLALPGGHHFDENYEALAEKLMEAIRQRQAL